ncbi:RdgB/HAM1 family non-canonical purine NTP pyrophosphatase [Pectinatus haikarae]|uniref:dITP/XTP pyrophosphatase n=2 Tax=Pectinatus haikarae TaxID=349096 RepID=A0ABT9YA70_9FIRM|nr:RdgB/HAM1 family non-canonical purine NTP pyrophosphatase [Pectinatus haikarae]MDQ0204436.1 XTP/dITP diphosphohydrolase [Pectinatus haikarae]
MEDRQRAVKMKTIIIATKNKGKIREMAEEFAELPVIIRALDEFGELPDAVESGHTFAENARIKAAFYSRLTGQACLADDSGLEIDILDKRPGIYSARFAGDNASDGDNNKKMISEMKKAGVDSSNARYKCVLAFFDINGRILQAEGECEGKIKLSPKGSNGFGYDPYFYIRGGKKSMAEISALEKNEISHRGKAVKRMKILLAEYLA